MLDVSELCNLYNGFVKEGLSRGRRDLLVPTLVVLVGWALCLATWLFLIGERRQAILESTAEVADETQQLVEKAVKSHLTALDELALFWDLVGRRPLEHWQADVDGLIHNFPALDFVAWIDPVGHAHRGRAGNGRPDRELPDLDELSRTSVPGVFGPERNGRRGDSLRIVLPVGVGGDEGLLVSRIDLEGLLAATLQGVAPRYAVFIRWGDEDIFSRNEPSVDPWQDWWRAERTMQLPRGIVWHLVHRPTPELAAARLTPIPHYLLASGLLISLLLGVLIYQLRLTRRQSRFLAASNRALAERSEQLEERVLERTRELEEAVAELRRFNQTVSHDLRSPLSAVLNFTAILEEDYRDRPIDADGLAVLQRIRRSATRATLLLEGLQRLSRIGRASLEMAPIDMGRLAREMFAQVRVAEDDAEVELVVGELPQVVGDRALLGDVFANLFTNAFKYSRGREKRRIAVRGTRDDGRCIYEVEDNGRGFDMRFRSKLFGLFERLDPEDGVGGTGLGLAVVERILKRHGGRVWAEGRPGEGARFCFDLPGLPGRPPVSATSPQSRDLP